VAGLLDHKLDHKGCRVEISYHLDEPIDAVVAAGLRLRGVDVTTTVISGVAMSNAASVIR